MDLLLIDLGNQTGTASSSVLRPSQPAETSTLWLVSKCPKSSSATWLRADRRPTPTRTCGRGRGTQSKLSCCARRKRFRCAREHQPASCDRAVIHNYGAPPVYHEVDRAIASMLRSSTPTREICMERKRRLHTELWHFDIKENRQRRPYRDKYY